jgi:hypothetical protein
VTDQAAQDRLEPAGPGGGKRPISERTLLEQMGGVHGMAYSAAPIVLFVVVNSLANLTAAIWSALGAAAAIAVVRLVRKETLQPAFAGFFGVAIAAFIAYRTGEARGFFLWGIWVSLVYSGVFVVSVLVRWPIVGVVWNFLNGSGMAWRKDKVSLRAYDIATLVFAAVFGARYVVQNWLYSEDLTGWLAVARISMGLPLFALALLVTVWAVRRSNRRMKELAEAEEAEELRLREKYGEPAPER